MKIYKMKIYLDFLINKNISTQLTREKLLYKYSKWKLRQNYTRSSLTALQYCLFLLYIHMCLTTMVVTALDWIGNKPLVSCFNILNQANKQIN